MLPNGVYLAAGLGWPSFNIEVYNINDGSLVMTLVGHTGWLNDLVLISSTIMASSGGTADGTIRFWDLTTNTTKFVLTGGGDVAGLKLIYSDVLASGASDNNVRLWNTTSGQPISVLSGHTFYIIFSVDLLSNGQTLVSGSWDQTLKLWHWSTGQCLITLNTSLTINSLATVKSKFFFVLKYVWDHMLLLGFKKIAFSQKIGILTLEPNLDNIPQVKKRQSIHALILCVITR